MENSLEQKIKNIMATVFEISVEMINNESSSETIESWDSLRHMNLVMTLEEEFNIVFTDDDIVKMINYQSTVSVVEMMLLKKS